MKINTRLFCISLFCLFLSGLFGCVGTAIETATDAAVAVAKIPFKVGGAVVDVDTDDDKSEEDEK